MTDIEAVKMSDEEMSLALDLAHIVLSPDIDERSVRAELARALLAAHALIEKQRAVVDAAGLFVDMVESAERQRTVRGSKGMGTSLPGEPLSYIQPSAFRELWKLRGLFSRALDTLASVGGEE